MLVRLFLPQVLDNRLTPRAERVSSIENVDDDVGRVEDLVELSPYTTGCTLLVDSLSGCRGGGVVSVCWVKAGVV